MPTSPALLTTGEVAEMCAVTPDSVRRWIFEGKLAGIRLPGGSLRVPRADVEALLNTPATEATAQPA
jgi:excisionase family DNA binding protein